MKKTVFSFLFLLGLSLFLVSCSGGSSKTASDMIDTLEGDGYALEQRDEDSREYYQANMVNDKYDLDVDVIDLYVGYVNSRERWAEIVVLKNATQAEAFYDELMIENTVGRFVIMKENVIILTFSSETANLFSVKE
ncbi:MAG: hypothetical protein KKH92_09055 [Firmicutes bacterium]|nr:hypothetical protein [Bacillota bacterium]